MRLVYQKLKNMKSEPLNPVQLYLLKMFSYAKDERALEEIRKSLTAYFAQRVEEDMDKLWDEGLWDQDKNEAILKEHLRVPYNCLLYTSDSELLHSLRIEEMLKQVLGMLEMTKNALNEENLELALNVFSKDNLLDEINAAAPAVLTKYLETHPDNFLTCLELGTVIRKLERAGDHITNIAEEIVFFIDAKVLKHRDKVDGHFLGKEKTH